MRDHHQRVIVTMNCQIIMNLHFAVCLSHVVIDLTPHEGQWKDEEIVINPL
jgi:hypothetical protein